MRTFDFTNGKQFPETLHIHKSVPYEIENIRNSFFMIPPRRALSPMTAMFWDYALSGFVSLTGKRRVDCSHYPVLYDYVKYVIERVPIYFVNKEMIGQTIDVQETAYSMYETVVPDNSSMVVQVTTGDMGRGYEAWESAFRDFLESETDERRDPNRGFDYPFEHEITLDVDETPDTTGTMVTSEAEALYCPMGGDPGCQESNPEIFVYMDYFVDADGHPTRPRTYLSYVIAHELAHAMMDVRLWEAFLCKTGQTLSKGISHNSKCYRMNEEGLATAIGWLLVGFDKEVARDIMRKSLPYRFGLSPYFFVSGERMSDSRLVNYRIPEWLSAKMYDPIPYL